jgi:hypothetical protein
VYKWTEFLAAEPDISYRITELSGRGNEMAGSRSATPLSPLQFLISVPESGDMTHAEYGQFLDVDRFDPLLDKSERLHLWYLIDSNNLLRSVLLSGVKYWGQLDNFLLHNGRLQGVDQEMISSWRVKMKLFDRFLELYRKGRPKPIGRSELERSGSITQRFMDEVSDKLKGLGGDPASLLEALRNKEIPGFRTTVIPDLEQFLLTGGYLSEEQILERDEILVELRALLTQVGLDSQEVEIFINRVLR